VFGGPKCFPLMPMMGETTKYVTRRNGGRAVKKNGWVASRYTKCSSADSRNPPFVRVVEAEFSEKNRA